MKPATTSDASPASIITACIEQSELPPLKPLPPAVHSHTQQQQERIGLFELRRKLTPHQTKEESSTSLAMVLSWVVPVCSALIVLDTVSRCFREILCAHPVTQVTPRITRQQKLTAVSVCALSLWDRSASGIPSGAHPSLELVIAWLVMLVSVTPSSTHEDDLTLTQRCEHNRMRESLRFGTTERKKEQLISLTTTCTHLTDAGGAQIDVDSWGDF